MRFPIQISKRFYSSALYITGDKATNHFVVLTPYIDYNERNKELLAKSIAQRGLKIDLNQIEKRYSFYKEICSQKKTLEENKLKLLKQISNSNSNEAEKLKIHYKLIKDDLKNLKEVYYGIDGSVHEQILSLPNSLHPKTPENQQVIYEFSKPILEALEENHLKIAPNLILMTNPIRCYLLKEAAILEQCLTNYFKTILLKNNFILFSNPDFARSIIVEGCGNDFSDNTKILTLQNHNSLIKNELSNIHLMGGGSLESFMAYFAKHLVNYSSFPLKYVSIGRKYNSSPVSELSLFNTCQQSVLSFFTAYMDSEDDLYEEMLKLIQALYDPLGYHYKLILLPAKELDRAESLRVSIQMYSQYLSKYVEVGNLSLFDSYLSKRLIFTCKKNKEWVYPSVMAGTLLNIHKFIGCALENNYLSGKPLLCDHVLKYKFV